MYWISVIGLFVVTLIIKAFSDPIPGEFNCAIGPLAIAGAGLATQAISGFLGGNKQGELSKEVQDLLKANVRKDRSTQFLPDKSAFDAQLKAQLDELFAKLGVNLEDFNAGAASRGTLLQEKPRKESSRTLELR